MLKVFRRIGFIGIAVFCGCTPPPTGNNGNDNQGGEEAQWSVVLSDIAGGLLSVSGTTSEDIYAVGADPEDGMGPMFLHYDGTQWTRMSTGETGTLWWVTDRAINGTFFASGESGLILRYDPSEQTFDRHETPGTETIFGIWGISENNILAVGGFVDDPENSGVIWRYDGEQWSVEDLSAVAPEGFAVAFKVWGNADDDIYVCGGDGLMLHYDGSQWERLETPTTRTLFTVHGDSERVVACGGAQSGVLIEREGSADFQDVTPTGLLQMNGVYVDQGGLATSVGIEGEVAFLEAGNWIIQETGLSLGALIDYHGSWIDPDGGVWAVGGNLLVEPQTDGVVAHYGTDAVAAAFVP